MSSPEKLIKSAKAGNLREVRKMLGRNVQITKDKFGNTALHEAAWNGHSDIVKVLLHAFCFVDSINNSGFTPLHLASQNGHGKVVKTLLKWRADPSLLNQHGETALHLAAKYNHSTVISVLASFKVNMDVRGMDSNTPLHIAAKLGNTESMKALLRGGASPHLTNERGARPVDYAEIGGFKSAVKILSSKSKMRSRIVTDSVSRTPTPTEKEPKGTPQARQTATYSPKLQRANTVSARINFRLAPKKQNSLPHGLTASMLSQTCGGTHESPPPNPYEDLDQLEVGSNFLEITPKPPTIDQMLTEIEQECHGPDYKYCPPGGRRPTEKSREGLNGTITPLNLKKQTDSSPQHSRAMSFDTAYDTRRRLSFDSSTANCLHPDEMRAVHNAVDRTFKDYETIPFKPSSLSSDDDTYVFMAPSHDMQLDSPSPTTHSSQESYSPSVDQRGKITKRAIICSSPVMPEQKHEPNTSLAPARGILSQPSSLQQSQIDKYLQEELETMRRAFQIRLGQLEKRYQRQLRMEQQRNSGGAVPSVPVGVQLRPESTRGNLRNRRSSWHSCMSDSETDDPMLPGQIQRCGSSQGFESDCSMEESDVEWTPTDQSDKRILSRDSHQGNSSADGVRVQTTPKLLRTQSLSGNPQVSDGGLKGGARMWNVEQGNGARAGPVLSPDVLVEEGTLPPGTTALVNERVSEHKAKILHYLQQVSEAKIAAIERQYEVQMSEVENRYCSQATEKLSRLETRVKDLEKMLDLQTLV